MQIPTHTIMCKRPKLEILSPHCLMEAHSIPGKGYALSTVIDVVFLWDYIHKLSFRRDYSNYKRGICTSLKWGISHFIHPDHNIHPHIDSDSSKARREHRNWSNWKINITVVSLKTTMDLQVIFFLQWHLTNNHFIDSFFLITGGLTTTVTNKSANSTLDSEILLCIMCAARSHCRLRVQLLQKV